MNAIDLLRQQHRDAEELFGRYHGLARSDSEERREVARELISDLSVHAGLEETVFYPTVRDALPDQADEIDHDLQEHQTVKELLDDLEGCDPDDARFDELMGKIEQDVKHHVQDEEESLFPKVRDVLREDELEQLGDTLETLRHAVPTRPHPHEPSTPPGNLLSGPVAGALDRLRDGIRERVGSGRV